MGVGGISLLNSPVQFFEGTTSFQLRHKLISLLKLAPLNMVKAGIRNSDSLIPEPTLYQYIS